jgi:hypothetical protein
LRCARICGLLLAIARTLRPDTAVVAPVSFGDISARSGIGSVLSNGATAEKHQIETMPGGVAAFDFDGDGLLDIFVTNGARQPNLDRPDPTWWNRLYRNRGNGKFEDVTEKAGLRGAGSAWARPRQTTTTTAIPTSSSQASGAIISTTIVVTAPLKT